MPKPTSVLIVSKGHDYDHTAFHAMFAAMPDVVTTLVEQPAAQVLLEPEHVGAYDCVLFYDMSGIPGIGLLHDGANNSGVPPPKYRAAIESMLARGTGIVMLNHATVSWPEWPLWREISGSSFMLRRGLLDGIEVPGSGYRGGHGPLPNPTIKLRPTGPHPVLAGLDDGFEITDEIYLKTAGFESRVVPLLRADYDFVARTSRRRRLHRATSRPGGPSARQQRDRVGECGRRESGGRVGRRRRSARVCESGISDAAAECIHVGRFAGREGMGSARTR